MTTNTPEYRREYNLKNKERIAKRKRLYQLAHKKEIAAYLKAYRKNNAATIKEKKRLYYLTKVKVMKKVTIKQQTEDLQKAMIQAHDDYLKARDALVPYEGKVIDDVGLEKVNAILKTIQEKFKNLYPALNFIQMYTQFSTNSINSYADFIDSIKKEGARPDEEVKA